MNETTNNTSSGSRSLRRLVTLAAILAVGLLATTAGPAAAARQQSVPFTASIAGTLSPTGPGPTGLPTFALSGTGKSNPLGTVRHYNATVMITSGDLVNGPISDVLTETLTAANGDTLTIVCQQVATLTSTGSGVIDGTDTWTVTGGTGRFRNATGSGTGHTHADLNAGTFSKNMTGTITY